MSGVLSDQSAMDSTSNSMSSSSSLGIQPSSSTTPNTLTSSSPSTLSSPPVLSKPSTLSITSPSPSSSIDLSTLPASVPTSTTLSAVTSLASDPLPLATESSSITAQHAHAPLKGSGSGPTSATSTIPNPTVTPAPDDPEPPPDDPDDPDDGIGIPESCLKVLNIKCAFTRVIIEETSAVPLGNPFSVPLPTGSESLMIGSTTYMNLATTAVVFAPVVIHIPAPIRTPSSTFSTPTSIGGGLKLSGPSSTFPVLPIPTVLTNSLGIPTATSTISAAVIPTFSAVTDGQGLVVSSVAFNLTTAPPPSPTPPPETLFTYTSWTTYMAVNGSTVPAIAGQVGVLTTVSKTYVLEPSTTVPIEIFTLSNIEPARTSLPSSSSSSSPNTGPSNRASKTAAAIVGSLVGATLLSVFLWVVWTKHRRRQRRTSDYEGYQSPMWGSRSVEQSSSRNESILDLNGQPEQSTSFVEPWVQGREPPTMSRKMQREMEEHGGGLMVAGPSHGATITGSSAGQTYNTPRPAKSASHMSPGLQSEQLAQSDRLSSIYSSQESIHSSAPTVPTRPLAQSPPLEQQQPQLRISPIPNQDNAERARQAAIPPRYNEAWNIHGSASRE